jgi:hypothetical protein
MSENITITVPAGTTFQNNHTFCVPPKWTNIATFFLTNYVSHAVTVKSLPGEPPVPSLLAILLTLFIPGSGVARAVSAIHQRAVFCSDPLTTATRAEALCMVVRTEGWESTDAGTVQGLRTAGSDVPFEADANNNAREMELDSGHELEQPAGDTGMKETLDLERGPAQALRLVGRSSKVSPKPSSNHKRYNRAITRESKFTRWRIILEEKCHLSFSDAISLHRPQQYLSSFIGNIRQFRSYSTRDLLPSQGLRAYDRPV